MDVSGQMQPILNTESATLGETFTENTINSVPLNGRDFSQLTVYTVGAVAPGFNSFGMGDSTERDIDGGTQVAVNGNRQQSNNYLLDGQEINENINNTLGYNPSPDALSEVRVIESNANAEFGNVNGGTILAVMKSGGNSLHGSVFGYLKNNNLDANSWANDNNVAILAAAPDTEIEVHHDPVRRNIGRPHCQEQAVLLRRLCGLALPHRRAADIEHCSYAVPYRRFVVCAFRFGNSALRYPDN